MSSIEVRGINVMVGNSIYGDVLRGDVIMRFEEGRYIFMTKVKIPNIIDDRIRRGLLHLMSNTNGKVRDTGGNIAIINYINYVKGNSNLAIRGGINEYGEIGTLNRFVLSPEYDRASNRTTMCELQLIQSSNPIESAVTKNGEDFFNCKHTSRMVLNVIINDYVEYIENIIKKLFEIILDGFSHMGYYTFKEVSVHSPFKRLDGYHMDRMTPSEFLASPMKFKEEYVGAAILLSHGDIIYNPQTRRVYLRDKFNNYISENPEKYKEMLDNFRIQSSEYRINIKSIFDKLADTIRIKTE